MSSKIGDWKECYPGWYRYRGWEIGVDDDEIVFNVTDGPGIDLPIELLELLIRRAKAVQAKAAEAEAEDGAF